MARIVVVGGSLGGLLAANLLHRDGHDVSVLEKAAEPLDGRGAGIVTHAALHAALRRAGVTVDSTLGVRVASRVLLDSRGETIAQHVLPQVLTSWSRLHVLLRQALPAERYLSGVNVQRVDVLGDAVAVHAGARSFDAAICIASDGLRSVVRRQLEPDSGPIYAGYVAWRGVCDEASLSRFTLGTLFEHFGFGLPAGEQMLGYPVAGAGDSTQPGQRRYNWVWYRGADQLRALRELLTDADGEFHSLGVPPHKVSWRQIAAMREAARRLLAPQFAEVVEKTAQPFLQPIFDLQSKCIAFDRVALMGDAAFVARPHVGMGVTKAAEDAVALADCIARHGATPAALAAYQALRGAPGQAVVERSRQLGAYMQAQSGPSADAAQRDAQQVLRETAIDLSGCSDLSLRQPAFA